MPDRVAQPDATVLALTRGTEHKQIGVRERGESMQAVADPVCAQARASASTPDSVMTDASSSSASARSAASNAPLSPFAKSAKPECTVAKISLPSGLTSRRASAIASLPRLCSSIATSTLSNIASSIHQMRHRANAAYEVSLGTPCHCCYPCEAAGSSANNRR